MNISVTPCGWGVVRTGDIEVLLLNTVSHLNGLLRDMFTGTIRVIPAPDTEPYPMIHYRSKPSQSFIIQLTSRGRHWAQFAYQFSHEFCHALSDYERLRDNPNNWFHEALCELASVFTLRRMAERWPTCPPPTP